MADDPKVDKATYLAALLASATNPRLEEVSWDDAKLLGLIDDPCPRSVCRGSEIPTMGSHYEKG